MIEPFVKQERLVSGTNIKTINGVSQLGAGNLSVSGSVATDVIWDAAGDLAVGTGLDTAARLARGTALQVLHVNSAGTTVEYVGSSGTGNIARVANPAFTGTLTAEAITASGTVLVNGSAGVSGVAITNDATGTNFKNQASNIVFLAYTFWGSSSQSVVGVDVSTVRVTTGVNLSSVICAGNTTTGQGFISYRSDGIRVSSGQFDVVLPDITLSRLNSTTWQFGSGNANNALGNIALAAIIASGTITGSNLSGTNTGDKTLSELLPTMVGQSGKYLTNNGTVESWGTVVAPTWGAITGTLASQTDLQSALNLKAPLASPTFTGTVSAPTLKLGSAALYPSLDVIAGGTIRLLFDTTLGSDGLLIRGSDGATYATLGYGGVYTQNYMSGLLSDGTTGILNIGGGQLHVTHASGNRSIIKSYGNLELQPGGLSAGPGTYVEINNGTAGTANYRDLKCRDIMATSIDAASIPNPYAAGYLKLAADLGIDFYAAGVIQARFASTGLAIGTSPIIGGTGVGQAIDATISRQAAGIWQLGTTTSNALGSLACAAITASGTAILGIYTVATLPSASANPYAEANVSDALAPVMGSTVVTGGAVKTKVRSNGTNWTVCGI